MIHNGRNKITIPRKSKIALVCSGGAAKAGAYHLGVALALKEKGFQFVGGLIDEDNPVKMRDRRSREISIYVGSSAGAIISSFLAAGYSLDNIFDSFLKKKAKSQGDDLFLKPLTYTRMFSLKKESGLMAVLAGIRTEDSPRSPLQGLKHLMSGLAQESYRNVFQMSWTKLPGLFSTSGIEKYLREDVLPSNDFSRYKADLFLVATQLNHSKKVVFGKYNDLASKEDRTCGYVNSVGISHAAAASTALPPIFAPYPIPNENGRKVYYFDGEIRDTLSTHVALDAGADLVFASYTHQPYHFSREVGSLHEFGIPQILIQTVYLMIERKIQQYRQFNDRARITYDAIEKVLEESDVDSLVKEKCLRTFQQKMNFRRDVDYIHIHPRPGQHEMFFGDHFNLSSEKLKRIVHIGFKNAIDTLRKYEFE